ncbi:MAG: ABC transporter permease subunit [Candidatus Lokiarchaeota archaeon]|nr:ABC transporter permease subunit [Candidatus Lokiarchaeota archaeon]
MIDQELENLESEKESENIFILRAFFSWIKTHLKFFFIPGYVDDELFERQREYEKSKSQRKFISRLKSTLTAIGFIIIIGVVTCAVFAPWISVFSFDTLTSKQWGSWDPPSPVHPLGQTALGADVLGRIIWGARSSLTVALPALFMSVSLGMVVGIIAAYYGGWVDTIIMRIMDIFLAFPFIILVLFIIAILGTEMEYIIIAYGILGIAGYSRLIRGSVLQAKNLPYVEAARVAGASNARIMFKHILPNCIQPIIVAFTFDIGGVILSLAGLSFLGFGDPTLIEWGYDINLARYRFYDAPWASFWPGFMIVLTVLGFMLLGDGLRDALDPRLRNI